MPESIPSDESSPTPPEPTPAPAAPQELARIGGILRQAREARGLSLEDLADQLRMGRDQLLALESAAVERLPEKVFVVAQARRVATALGLEVDPLIEELRRVEFGPSTAPQSTIFKVSPPAAEPTRAAGAGWPLAGLGILALVAVGAGLAWHQWRPPAPTQASVATPPSPPPSPPLSPSPSPSPAAVQRVSPQPANSPQPPNAPNAPKPPEAGVLVLSSAKGSWVTVRSAKGENLFEGLLRGDRTFPLGSGVQVLAGRPDLVTVRIGTAVPRTLGTIDQVVWRRFRAP